MRPTAAPTTEGEQCRHRSGGGTPAQEDQREDPRPGQPTTRLGCPGQPPRACRTSLEEVPRRPPPRGPPAHRVVPPADGPPQLFRQSSDRRPRPPAAARDSPDLSGDRKSVV